MSTACAQCLLIGPFVTTSLQTGGACGCCCLVEGRACGGIFRVRERRKEKLTMKPKKGRQRKRKGSLTKSGRQQVENGWCMSQESGCQPSRISRDVPILSQKRRVPIGMLFVPIARIAGYVFTPTEKEKNDRLLHVRYSATKDEYCRLSNNSEIIQSWDQCVWRKESVFRKVETDWQMVYIARTEGSSSGKISWKFDLGPVGLKMKSVSVMASSQTFHSGKVCWRLQAGQITTEFAGDGKMQMCPRLAGSSELTVEADLSGGDGETSWQHSQLFRQSLKRMEDSSFEIIIHLEDV